MRRLTVLPVLCGLAAMAGCRSLPPTDHARVLEIAVAFEPPNVCRVNAAGQTFTLPAEDTRFQSAMKQQAKIYQAARILGGPTIPYKCIGFAIFLAQGAGFKRVGFIAEPPKY